MPGTKALQFWLVLGIVFLRTSYTLCSARTRCTQAPPWR